MPSYRLWFGNTGYAVVLAANPEDALLKLPKRKRAKVTRTDLITSWRDK